MDHHFTSEEQSRKLLELGVPVDTADCYLEDCTYRVKVIPTEKGDTYSTLKRRLGGEMALPCWSVGRLIEIYEVCLGSTYQHTSEKSLIDELLDKLPYVIKTIQNYIKRYRFY